MRPGRSSPSEGRVSLVQLFLHAATGGLFAGRLLNIRFLLYFNEYQEKTQYYMSAKSNFAYSSRLSSATVF